jgi:hypothetical protein
MVYIKSRLSVLNSQIELNIACLAFRLMRKNGKTNDRVLERQRLRGNLKNFSRLPSILPPRPTMSGRWPMVSPSVDALVSFWLVIDPSIGD